MPPPLHHDFVKCFFSDASGRGPPGICGWGAPKNRDSAARRQNRVVKSQGSDSIDFQQTFSNLHPELCERHPLPLGRGLDNLGLDRVLVMVIGNMKLDWCA